MDLFPWAGAFSPSLPCVEFRLLHDGQALYVRFDVWEKNICATYTQPNDPVCRDSCVEFFFRPNRDDPHYLSFEINPLGALLIGLSTSEQDLQYFADDRGMFCVKTQLEPEYWYVEYKIPFAFIHTCFPVIDRLWSANFMKCADRSVTPHHGCWNLIKTDIPMFHVPQYFGEIELVNFTGDR